MSLETPVEESIVRCAPPRPPRLEPSPHDAWLAGIAADLCRIARQPDRECAAGRAELLVAVAERWPALGRAQRDALALIDGQLARHGHRDALRAPGADTVAAQRLHLGPLARLRILCLLLARAAPADGHWVQSALVAMVDSELRDGALLADHCMRLGALLAASLPRLSPRPAQGASSPRLRAMDVLARLTRTHGKLGQERAFELTGGPLSDLASVLPQLDPHSRAGVARLLLSRLDLARRQALLPAARKAANHLRMIDDHLRPWQKLLESRVVLPQSVQQRVVSRFHGQFDGEDELAADAAAQARLDTLYFWRAERWCRILSRLPADARRAKLAARVLCRLDGAVRAGARVAEAQQAAIERIGTLCVEAP